MRIKRVMILISMVFLTLAMVVIPVFAATNPYLQFTKTGREYRYTPVKQERVYVKAIPRIKEGGMQVYFNTPSGNRYYGTLTRITVNTEGTAYTAWIDYGHFYGYTVDKYYYN